MENVVGRRTNLLRVAMALALAALILASALAPGLAAAKDPPGPLGSPGYMDVDNGVIHLAGFGELDSFNWIYPATVDNLYQERPYLGYGANLNQMLPSGTVVTPYPATGAPGVWHDAVVDLKLDAAPGDDVSVRRSVMVPPGAKYFLVRYTVENISGQDLPDFRFLQGVDYDIGSIGGGDEAGYDPQDFVWAHDVTQGLANWVGFKGSAHSDAHSVDTFANMFNQLWLMPLNNANYFYGDPGVGMQWDFGTLAAGDTAELTVKFAFADSSEELGRLLVPPPPVPAVTTWGAIGMAALLGVALALALWTARRRSQRA